MFEITRLQLAGRDELKGDTVLSAASFRSRFLFCDRFQISRVHAYFPHSRAAGACVRACDAGRSPHLAQIRLEHPDLRVSARQTAPRLA